MCFSVLSNQFIAIQYFNRFKGLVLPPPVPMGIFTLPNYNAGRSKGRRTFNLARLRKRCSLLAHVHTGPTVPLCLGLCWDCWSPGGCEVVLQAYVGTAGRCSGRTGSTLSSVCDKHWRSGGDKCARGIQDPSGIPLFRFALSVPVHSLGESGICRQFIFNVVFFRVL